MAINSAFSIVTNGSWPLETYTITPDSTLLDPNVGFLPAEMMFRYFNQPLNETNSIHKVYYNNSNYSFIEDYSQYAIDFSKNASFTWDASAHRWNYNLGPQFNYFIINPNPDTAPGYRFYYSYLLYPTRLFLKPLSLSKNSDSWTLQTSAVLIDSKTIFCSGYTDKTLGYNDHLNYYNSPPSFSPLTNSFNGSLVFSLSSYRSYVDIPVIKFSESYNPGSRPGGVPVLLEGAGGKIRPDSTFVTYNIKYSADNQLLQLGQQIPYSVPGMLQQFKTSYILNQDFLNTNQQIYQLLQFRPDNSNLNLSSISLCVLSASIDLETDYIRYYSKGVPGFTHINSITGIPGSYLGISYEIDSPTILQTTESCINTLNSFKFNATDKPLNTPLDISNSFNSSINWNTKYPPHYYSFKTTLSTNNKKGSLAEIDTSNLSFHLVTKINSLSTTAATLSTYIASDQEIFCYDLVNNTLFDEEVKFEPASFKEIYETAAVKCYYGSNFQYQYDLLSSPWIPASAANIILIDYPKAPYGNISINLKATLKNSAGQLASKTSCYFELDDGEAYYERGQPIYLEVLDQQFNYIDVSCAHLSASPGWPTRDLRNSFIEWTFTPSSIPGISIYSIDANGNKIQDIPANQPILFSENTSTVRFDNLSFNLLSAGLVSHKYAESTYTEYTSGLQTQLTNRQYVIGAATPLNNLEETRYITLTAAIPYRNQLFHIPHGTTLCWSWAYNFEKYLSPHVKVFYYKNGVKTPYSYGEFLPSELISAVNVEIKPDKNSSARLNSVKFAVANYNVKPFIRDDFEFFVDDFPDRSILNSDFSITYANFTGQPSATVLNTANDQIVLTRPNDGTNFFLLSCNNSARVHPETTYVWSICDNVGNSQNITYQFSNLGARYININPNATHTIVTLSALSALSIGTYGASWDSENVFGNSEAPTSLLHSVYATSHIFTPSPEEFYRPLEFITYPEYAWPNSRYLTLATPSNYSTIINSPTAYQHKKSKSQTFYLSANKSFEEYDYYFSSSSEWTSAVKMNFVKTLSSTVGLIDFPYVSAFFTNSGCQLSLSAYSFEYPVTQPRVFVKPSSTNLAVAKLSTYFFNTTATNVNYLSALEVNKPFRGGPRLVPYQTIPRFDFQILNEKINLDFDRTVTISQTIKTFPAENPARPIDGQGTVTYILSSNFWFKTVEIPAKQGVFDLFTLEIGDPYEVGYVSNSDITYLSLKPLQIEVPYKIPASTFNNYSSSDYTKERDLWEIVTHKDPLSGYKWDTFFAYSTSVLPEVYVSDIFALTGQNIYINYTTPNESFDKKIIHYITKYNSSDLDLSIKSLRGEAGVFSYNTPGTYYISYDVYYNDGSVISGTVPHPIIIKPYWTSYSQEDIRTLDEKILTLPHSLNEIEIQPNEWGDADVYNSSVTKIYENFKYLEANIQSINTDSPTVYFGWLGSSSNLKSQGIRWFTQGFDSGVYKNISSSVNEGASYFSSVTDSTETEELIFLLDNGVIRAFENKSFKPQEILFKNLNDFIEEFVTPSNLTVDWENRSIYLLDTPRNKVVKLVIDEEFNINIPLSVGGFGTRSDTTRFNTPTEMFLAEDSIFVLDYGNSCVKEYTKDLNWINTFYVEEFLTDKPISISSRYKNFVYVLTQSGAVYIFSEESNQYFSKLILSNPFYSILKIKQMSLDEPGEFLYFLFEDNSVHKYSAVGTFICQLTLPDSSVKITKINSAFNRNLLLNTKHAIIKIQDIVSFFKIGQGLPYKTWNLDQILLSNQEMPSDLNYNRSLLRLSHNIKAFRDNLNSRFVIIKEVVPAGLVTYFTLAPISNLDKPNLGFDIENDLVSIGVNEFHIPQVLNREFAKLHEATNTLLVFLNITDANLPDLKVESKGISIVCPEGFCWSWKAMAGFNLTLPNIRICSVNPITYSELKSDFALSYAPTIQWSEATSTCCEKLSGNLDVIKTKIIDPFISPVIISQPVSGSILKGEEFSFSVKASGTPVLRYQWYKNQEKLDGANLSTLNAISSGAYYAEVSNLYGSVSSDSVLLEVEDVECCNCEQNYILSQDNSYLISVSSSISSEPNDYIMWSDLSRPQPCTPRILSHPKSVYNTPFPVAQFKVVATGTLPLSYQWLENEMEIEGETSNTLYILDITTDIPSLKCRISNQYGSIVSQPASLTVGIPPTIVLQPVTQVTDKNTPKTFFVEATGSLPFSYQWYKNNSIITNAISASYTEQTPIQDAVYKCLVTNKAGFASSNEVKLSILEKISIIKQPASIISPLNSKTSLEITAVGAKPINYQWYKNGKIVQGATNNSLAFSSLKESDMGLYFCTVSNAVGSITSSKASVEASYVLDATISDYLGERSGTISLKENINYSSFLQHRIIALGSANTYYNCGGGSSSLNLQLNYTDINNNVYSTTITQNQARYRFCLFIKIADKIYFYKKPLASIPSDNSSMNTFINGAKIDFLNNFIEITQASISDTITHSKTGPCYGGLSSYNKILRFK